MTNLANKINLVAALVACIGLWLLVSPSENERLTLQRTLALGLASAAIAVPLGAMLANLCRRSGLAARVLMLTTVALLFFPLFLQVSVWDAAFGKLGWLTSTRGQVLTPIVSPWVAAAWIHGIAAAPQVALIFLLGMTTGQKAYEEQALLDSNRPGVFWQVSIWRILPLVLLSVLWVFVTCSREIAVTDLYQIGTLAEQIYLGYSLGSLSTVAGNWSTEQIQAATDFRLGSGLLIPAGIAVVTSIWLVNLIKRDESSSQWTPVRLSKPTIGSRLLIISLLLLMVAVPLGNVVYRCGFIVRPVAGVAVSGFSSAQFWQSLTRALTNYSAEFTWSLLIAVTSATLILVSAVIIAWSALNNRFWRCVLWLVMAICLALPGPLIATLLIAGFSDLQSPLMIWLYDRTILAPVIANTVFCWPPAAILVWFLFNQIDSDELDAARLDGTNRLATLVQVGLRGRGIALAGCWLLTFALCFGELSASQLVLPPGMDTLPRLMLGLLHAGVDEMTAGLAIVISFGIVVSTLFGYFLFQSAIKHRNTH